MEKVTVNQAAKLLGISVDKLEILEKQGLIHSTVNTEGVSSYSAEEIAQIKSRRGPTLAQEAEQVAIGIQREIVSSVKNHRKVLLAAGGVLSGYALLVALFTGLFFIYPLQTSDFLGYYYRSNTVKPQPSTSMIKGGSVLAAETGPAVASGEPSVLAYILKPVAAVALVPIKAVDNQKFLQVVTPPTAGAAGLSGQTGSPGANGIKGADGVPGLTGAQGLAGVIGSNGTNGTNGSNGINGTSVADVLTTPGSLIIRNATNTTVPLTAGSNGQVLTISAGIPAWENASTTATNFSGLLVGDVTGTQGLTVVGKINGAVLGTTTAASGNLLIGNGTQWATQAISNDATINSSGALTLKNTGTAGIYGSALNIPVLTTDAQGRVTGVTNTAIAGLTVSNFGSANISQWTNNAGFITASSTDTLLNKTISAGSNTISGLTNTNLSGTAGITNANLANSSLTIGTGIGLSGGSVVSLGGSVALTNSGVVSLTGTTNQVSVSGSTGGVTLSLPQSVGTSSSPSFAALSLTNTSNQLMLGTTNIGTLSWSPSTSRTLTLPDVTDTLIGKTTTDVLTNKTLTAPAINGIVTTTGLTLPAFTASGAITGSGSPTISSFGAINGLTLTAASDGYTIAGGASLRTLTLTGADITIGSTIKPTSSGDLTIQSNGANTLTLDAGGASNVNVGTTSASALTIGRSGVTTTINGTTNANNLKIGSGTTILKHLSATGAFDAPSVSQGSCSTLGTITVTNAAVGDTVVATPTPVSGGIETLLLTWNAYVSGPNTVSIRGCNLSQNANQNPGNQTWRVDVWQH